MPMAMAFDQMEDAPPMMMEMAMAPGPMKRGGRGEDVMKFRAQVKPAPAPRIMRKDAGNNKATNEQPNSTDSDSGEPKRFQGEADFMNDVKPNTRNWFHRIRKDFNKFDRIDFTQTLLFNSAKELEFTKDRTYTVSSSFSLNDQVSTFKI